MTKPGYILYNMVEDTSISLDDIANTILNFSKSDCHLGFGPFANETMFIRSTFFETPEELALPYSSISYYTSLWTDIIKQYSEQYNKYKFGHQSQVRLGQKICNTASFVLSTTQYTADFFGETGAFVDQGLAKSFFLLSGNTFMRNIKQYTIATVEFKSCELRDSGIATYYDYDSRNIKSCYIKTNLRDTAQYPISNN